MSNLDTLSPTKFPLLLPPDSTVTARILDHYHAKSGHQGLHITNGSLREAGFYIFKGRKLIKSMINNCVTCRKLRASCEQQFMADLPVDRVESSPPFSKVGLDVFGPWMIHDGTSTRKCKGTKKVWSPSKSRKSCSPASILALYMSNPSHT